MLLAIDVGNTNIVFAVFKDDKIVGKWRLSTDSQRTSDEYAVVLKELMSVKKIEFSSIDNVIISTVVPQHLYDLKVLCKEYFSCTPLVVGEEGVKIGIEIKLDRPSEVGADRVVNAVAAYDLYKCACIVIDFGTATTFDVVDGDGNYIGGLISPGINLSIEALHQAAAKLPEIAIKKPDFVIGKNTVSAMQSGVYFGYLGLIEGSVERIKEEYGSDMKVVCTGGLASLFFDATGSIDSMEQDLTINGLNKIFNMNSKK